MLIIITGFIFIVSYVVVVAEEDFPEFETFLLCVISGSILALMLIMLPVEHYIDYPSFKIELESLQTTINDARANNASEIERAAILQSIADANKGLASSQYFNTTWWADAFYPDEIMDLKPIK